MDEIEITTVEDLEGQLARVNDEGGDIMLNINADTDLSSLTNVIVENSKDAPKFLHATWHIDWCGNKENSDWTKLMNLIRAAGLHHLTANLHVSLPIKCGDLAKLPMTLRSAGVELDNLFIYDQEVDSSRLKTGEDAERELIDFLNEFCLWGGKGAKQIELHTSVVMTPVLLEKMAELLPKLSLKILCLMFREPPNCDAANQSFIHRMAQAFEELRRGLEQNYSLQDWGIWAGSDSRSPINSLLAKLGDDKLEFLLDLNRAWRGKIISMPLHRDTWLEILAQHSDDDSPTGRYYYLRLNTWMFEAEKCIQKEIKSLNKELNTFKKRHREEIQQKDLEIQRLRAALEAGAKCQKTDARKI